MLYQNIRLKPAARASNQPSQDEISSWLSPLCPFCRHWTYAPRISDRCAVICSICATDCSYVFALATIQLTDDLFANDSFCMAGLRTKTIGIYEKGTGRKITCRVEGYPYSLIWSAPAKPVRFVCIEPWHSLPAAETDPQAWSQRAAAACLAPGESWETTLSTTFDR